MNAKYFIVFLALLLSGPVVALPHVRDVATLSPEVAEEGIRFACQPDQIDAIESGMDAYLRSMEIAPERVVRKLDRTGGVAVYTLNTLKNDTSTLDLNSRPEFGVRDEIVRLPARHGKQREVATVSKKEILLALMQHGRVTEFSGKACDVRALQEHIAIRQNIASWGADLHWVWPDGRVSKWNPRYWKRGTPRPGVALHAALNDAFLNQHKYSIGCYTASKLVIVQGVVDYYHRIAKNPAQLRRIEQRLRSDGEPLAGIEPGRMWDFEADFDPAQRDRPGKLLNIVYGIAPQNIVPGDWVHLRNTDPVSYRKTGYEGANPIYLGRNRFADYFADHGHSYSYEEKLDEVYQWRHGVFSRSRHADKIRPLSPEEMERLSLTPAEGGLLTDMRVFPYFFGYEELPTLPRP